MGMAKKYRVQCGGTVVYGAVVRYKGTMVQYKGTAVCTRAQWEGAVARVHRTRNTKKQNQFSNASSKIEKFVENWLCFCCFWSCSTKVHLHRTTVRSKIGSVLLCVFYSAEADLYLHLYRSTVC